MTELVDDRDPRTGEPRRPLLAWVALVSFLSAAGLVLVALLFAMWRSVSHFEDAAWLNRVVPTSLGDPFRVVLALGVWSIGVTIGAVASITGYYAWAGYGWTRWCGLVALALGGLSFMMNAPAPWCLPPLAVGAAVLWTPSLRRFFAAWTAIHHPEPRFPEVPQRVIYGPISRFGA